MKKNVFLLTLLCLFACLSCKIAPEVPRDVLLHMLSSYAENGRIAYGHQDDLSYGHSWLVTDVQKDPLNRSDVRYVAGAYPMVVGFDLGGIEMGDKANLDSVSFDLMRRAALKHIERGGIVTFSWHPRNPLTGGDAWDVSSDIVVKELMEGELQELFMGTWLKNLGDFLESLGDVPFIFRPWHENLGNWFWWGANLCTPEQYQELYQTTWHYLMDTRGMDNIVWCYSPNGPVSVDDYMSRYPGDIFVDILGTDIYEYQGTMTLPEAGEAYSRQVRFMLSALETLAQEHGKLLCLSETGLEGLPDPSWWTETLYPAICEYPICYVLTWRNAHDKPGHFYAPWKGFENADDFAAFAEKDDIVFLK